MYIISSIIFALSVNIDAFILGMSYGIRKVRITLLQDLLISLISFIGTLLSLILGSRILILLPSFLADCLGGCILLLLGIFYLVKSLTSSRADLHTESLRATLPYKEVLVIGAALSFNNIGIGIGASMSGILLLPAAVITFLISAVLLPLGNHLGSGSLFRLSGRCADLLSGVMLLLLGIWSFFNGV